MKNKFDLLILGSGSTAFAAALRAAELGKTVAMTEMRTLGGTCVNRGCLPSKNLIEAARIAWESAHPRYPGLVPAKMEVDFQQLITQKQDVVRSYRDRKYQSIVSDTDKIKVFDGQAKFLDKNTISVDGQKINGDQILIASGTRPIIPSIAGLDQVPYLTSDLLGANDSQELLELPESIIIIGGGYIALELGQMFHRFGSLVTILERSRRILPNYEPEVSRSLTTILREEGLNLITGAVVEKVLPNPRNEIETLALIGDGNRSFTAQKLIVATGREPNTDNLNIVAAGVQLGERGFVEVNDELQTNVPHIWAAGDVIGNNMQSQQATPVGAHDGVIAASNALGGEHRKADHRVIPRAIFTDPQVAVVGMTDAEANRLGYHCWGNTIPIVLVPRAGAIHNTAAIAGKNSGRPGGS